MPSFGPVPLTVVLALCCLAAAALLLRLYPGVPAASRRAHVSTLLDAFLLGWLGARVLFVLRNLGVYLDDPLSMLRIGDGGFDPFGFVVMGVGFAVISLRRRELPIRPVVTACVAGLVLWWAGVVAIEQAQARHAQLPVLALHDIDGSPVVLASAPGIPQVINLWATWCAPCIREMPVFEQAVQRHRGVDFVFVNQGEDAATVQAFLRQHAPALPGVLLDEDGALADALGVKAYPSTLFFDADGRLRELHLGELSPATLDHKLRRLR